MGFLDNSSNNIIIDAVLTDTGRAFLAKNDGSFAIVKFAFGDDEIDYTTIQKYGRTVGKERIEKNTPIFEAQTQGNIALKHKLISISNPNLLRLPKLVLAGTGLTGDTLSMTRSGGVTSKVVITVSQELQNESIIDVELRDQAFIVKLPNRFLQLTGLTPDSVNSDNVATYIVIRDADSVAKEGTKVTLNISSKTVTDAQFNVFGNAADKNTISSTISISGIQSGAAKEFDVQVTK